MNDIRRFFARVPADNDPLAAQAFRYDRNYQETVSLDDAGAAIAPTPAIAPLEATPPSPPLRPSSVPDSPMLSDEDLTLPNRVDLLAVPVMEGADGDPCVSEEPSLDSRSGDASSLICNESLDSDVPDPDAAYSQSVASEPRSTAELSPGTNESHAATPPRADLDGSEGAASADESDASVDEPPPPPRRRRRSNRAVAVPEPAAVAAVEEAEPVAAAAAAAAQPAGEERVVRPRRAPRKHVDSRSGHRHYRLQAKRILFTYSRCPVPREVIGRHLIDKFGGEDAVNMACVVQEHHADTDDPAKTMLHLHAAVELLVECDIKDCERHWDITYEGKTYHPNFQTIRNWTGAIKYIDKEDREPWEYNMILEDYLRKGLSKRAQLAVFCTRTDKSLWQKLEHIKRKWPDAIARRRDLDDVLWWISHHDKVTREPDPAPPPCHLVIPPRDLEPNDPWVPNWVKPPLEDDGYSFDLWNSYSQEKQQNLFERENPVIYIPIGLPRKDKEEQYWVYGKKNTFKSHLVRHLKNAAGNEMHRQYGVYEYPFPSSMDHVQTHERWIDDERVYQLIYWKEYHGQMTLADVNNFMEGGNEVPMRYLGGIRYKTINITVLVESQGSPAEVYAKASRKDPDRFEALMARFILIHAYDPITRTGVYDCRRCYLTPAAA